MANIIAREAHKLALLAVVDRNSELGLTMLLIATCCIAFMIFRLQSQLRRTGRHKEGEKVGGEKARMQGEKCHVK